MTEFADSLREAADDARALVARRRGLVISYLMLLCVGIFVPFHVQSFVLIWLMFEWYGDGVRLYDPSFRFDSTSMSALIGKAFFLLLVQIAASAVFFLVRHSDWFPWIPALAATILALVEAKYLFAFTAWNEGWERAFALSWRMTNDRKTFAWALGVVLACALTYVLIWAAVERLAPSGIGFLKAREIISALNVMLVSPLALLWCFRLFERARRAEMCAPSAEAS